jgi:hypothetical protein
VCRGAGIVAAGGVVYKEVTGGRGRGEVRGRRGGGGGRGRVADILGKNAVQDVGGGGESTAVEGGIRGGSVIRVVREVGTGLFIVPSDGRGRGVVQESPGWRV